jgi:hypothetical protein
MIFINIFQPLFLKFFPAFAPKRTLIRIAFPSFFSRLTADPKHSKSINLQKTNAFYVNRSIGKICSIEI